MTLAQGLLIRPASSEDATELEPMIRQLGYNEAATDIAARMEAMHASGTIVFVAVLDGRIAGCLSTSIMQVLHRPKKIGRISMMVVHESLRGSGIGRLLVDHAERHLVAQGCGLAEVTSALHREAAHSFYEHLGYKKTSLRLARDAAAD